MNPFAQLKIAISATCQAESDIIASMLALINSIEADFSDLSAKYELTGLSDETNSRANELGEQIVEILYPQEAEDDPEEPDDNEEK